MSKIDELIILLDEGKENAKRANELERDLNMDVGTTQEPTRDLIREAITTGEIPIGSTTTGYFIINSENELNEVVQSLENRKMGLQRRIDALRNGWLRRSESRNSGGNWPK